MALRALKKHSNKIPLKAVWNNYCRKMHRFNRLIELLMFWHVASSQ